jgi:hypothetical protein
MTYFLIALLSTPFNLSEDFCTNSYSADDMVSTIRANDHDLDDGNEVGTSRSRGSSERKGQRE